jgi:gliding motility-associated-like protein
MRIDVNPVIVSDTSVCIKIEDCPNDIFTQQPAVLSNPADTICVGSVIDVPFFSLGVFVNNTYIIQLSDSNGVFPPNPNVLGSKNDDTTYPPGGMPGSVPGLVRAQQQPIPEGCNYLIRVNGTSPNTIGTTYGPFCIRNCDIETNNRQDVSFCIDDVNGGDTLLIVKIAQEEPAAIYTPPNEFLIQLLDFQTFAVINTGVVGGVAATGDTLVELIIPNLPNLFTIGIIPGVYYLRIIATNSDQPWDTLGTLIRLTVGAPNPSPLSIDILDQNHNYVSLNFDGDTSLCFNTALFFVLAPYNPVSSYVWGLNNNPDFYDGAPYNPILFNSLGDYSITVRETNFGCVGPGSEPAVVHVQGFPSVSIIGPFQVCQGDTVDYRVPLNENTYYSWGVNPGIVEDTAGNVTTLYFPDDGSSTISVSAVNQCGNRSNDRTIQVKALPQVSTGNDTTICQDQQLTLSTPGGSNYVFYWLENDSLISQNQSVAVSPDSSTQYVIRVTNFGSLACENTDTINVLIQDPQAGLSDTLYTCDGKGVRIEADTTGDSYLWSTGEISPFILVNDTGWYYVYITFAGQLCPRPDSFYVKTKACFQPPVLVDSFSPNGDGINDAYTPKQTFTYDEFIIIIYNRWGLKVYESLNPYFEWNGNSINGKTLPDGTYFYIANYSHQDKSGTLKGSVTLLK